MTRNLRKLKIRWLCTAGVIIFVFGRLIQSFAAATLGGVVFVVVA